MKVQEFFGLVLALALLTTLSGAIVTSASTTYPDPGLLAPTTYTHGIPDPDVEAYKSEKSAEVPATTTAQNSAASPIIIDHTYTDLSKIPDYWIEQAKNLTLHYVIGVGKSKAQRRLPAVKHFCPNHSRYQTDE